MMKYPVQIDRVGYHDYPFMYNASMQESQNVLASIEDAVERALARIAE